MQIQTAILEVDDLSSEPAQQALDEAACLLRAGRLVVFPTETVYGLGANALRAEAVERIFAAKGRPATNPVIVHVASIEQARSLVTNWPRSAELLARGFWPGPLTLVLPKSANVPDTVTAGGSTVALRMPDHPVARALLERCSLPLAAPSANRSTRISPTTAAHVLKELSGRVDLILDAGSTAGGLESTVIDLTVEPPRLLRPGLLTAEQIEAVLGTPIERKSQPCGESVAKSPGQMVRHYAPNVHVELLDAGARERVCVLAATGERIGWLAMETVPANLPESVVAIEMPGDPAGYAARLYAALHTLEDAAVQQIVISRPPDDAPWEAVRDRLGRAAARAE